jgi:hypothetical protein
MQIPEVPFAKEHNNAMERIWSAAADTWHNAVKA